MKFGYIRLHTSLHIKWSYESLGLILIALVMSVGGIYSYSSISFLMPLLTLFLIWFQGGLKNISFHIYPSFFFLFLLLMWAGISVFWTPNPNVALKTLIALSVTFAFSFLFISCIININIIKNSSLLKKVCDFLKILTFFLIFLILLQVFADSLHIGLIKKYEGLPYMMKPTGSILGLISFVYCALLWINNNKILSVFMFVFLIFLIHLTLCQTAFYGILLATFIFVISYLMPFWTTRIAMVGSYTVLILSPVLFSYAFLPSLILKWPSLHWIVSRSFYHRFLAWDAYSEKFFEQPFLGWGLESTRSVLTKPFLAEGYENTIHPHNNALQAYVELGLIGGILYALFFSSLFLFIEKQIKDRLSVAVCNATLTFGFVASEINHNLWRNYWLSVVALTAGLLIFFLKAREAQLRA